MRKANQVHKILLIVLFVLAFFVSISFRTQNNNFIPLQAIKNIGGLLRILLGNIFDRNFNSQAVIDSLPFFNETFIRLKMDCIAGFSGSAICIGGSIFQTVFKNPIASPNILGVSTGVSFGNILFIIIYQLNAYSFLFYRYIYCYALSAFFVFLTVLAGKFLNVRRKPFSVEMMIITGMLITHLGQVFIQYFQYIISGDETGLLEVYMQFANGDILYGDNTSFTIFAVMLLISVIPVILLKYRMNAVAFTDDEMRAQGVSNPKLRMCGLLCGSMMAVVALIHCGDVGFLSMAVPFMCRRKGNTDFRSVALSSALIGGTLSLISRTILLYLRTAGLAIPASVVVTLLVLPIFTYTLIKRESAFE